jgi:hypothetical protein
MGNEWNGCELKKLGSFGIGMMEGVRPMEWPWERARRRRDRLINAKSNCTQIAKCHLQIITGNSDTQSPVLRWLDGGFVAKLVRLIPVSESIRTVCLRFELYGCPFKGRELFAFPLPK